MTDRVAKLGVELDIEKVGPQFNTVKSTAADMATAVGASGEKAAQGIAKIGDSATTAGKTLATLGGQTQELGKTFKDFKEQNYADALNKALGEGATKATQHNAAMKILGQSWKEYKDQIKEASKEQQQANKEAGDSVDKLSRQQQALVRQLENVALAGQNAGKSITDSLLAKGAQRGIDTTPFTEQIKNARAGEAALKAFNDAAAAEATALKTSSAATAAAAAQLEAFARQALNAKIELLSLGKTASEKLQIKANVLGLDKAATQPMIDSLREAEKAAIDAGVHGKKALNDMGMSAAATTNALRQVPMQFTDIVVSLQSGQAPLTVLFQQGGQLKDMFGGVGNAAKAMGGYVAGLINPFTLAAAAVGTLGFSYYKGSQEADAFNKALITTGNAVGTTTGGLQDMARNMSQISGTQGAAAEALAVFVNAGTVGVQNLQAFSTAALAYSKATGESVGDIAKQFAELGKDPLTASIKLNESMNYLTMSLYEQVKALQEQGKYTEAANIAQKAFADTLDSRSGEMLSKLGTIEKSWLAIKSAIKGAGDALLDIGRKDTLQQQIDAQRAIVDQLSRPGATTRKGLNLTAPVNDADIQKAKDALAILVEMQNVEARRVTNRAQEADLVKQNIEWDKEALKNRSAMVKMEDEILRVMNLGIAAGKTEAQIMEQVNAIIDKGPKPEKAKKEQIDANRASLGEYVKTLQKQLDKELELSEIQKAQNFLSSLGKLGEIEQVKELVLGIAAEIDARKEADVAIKAATKSAADYIREQEKEGRQLDNLIAKRIEDNDAIGKTKEQIAAFNAEKLIASAIADEENAKIIRSTSSYYEEADALDALAAKKRVLAGLDKEAETKFAGVTAADAAKKAAKDLERDFKKTADQINQSLTDSLMRGFESGKGFAEVFRDTVENMFKTMILRPTIRAFLTPVTQGLNSFTGSAAGSAAGDGIGGVVAGTGLAGAMSGMGTAYSAGWTAGGLGASVSTGAAYGASVAGGGLGTTMAGGLGTALGSIPVYGWAALAVIALTQMKGDYVKGSGYSDQNFASGSATGVQNEWIDRHGGYNPVDMFVSPEAKTFVDGLQSAYLNSIKTLGGTATGTTFGLSTNSAGGSVIVGGAGSNLYQSSEFKTADTAATQLAASRAIFTALQSSEMPEYLARVFNEITPASATQSDIDNAIGFATALKTTRDALLETRKPLDILKDTVAAGFATLGTNATDWKKDFVAAIDAGLTPETFAQWSELGNNVTKLGDAAGAASRSVAEIAQSLAGLVKTGAQLGIDLQTITDPSGAKIAQRALDTAGLSQAEIDQYDTNATTRTQIDTAKTFAGWVEKTADLAASATPELQRAYDKQKDLNGVTDEGTIALINAYYAQLNLNDANAAAAVVAEQAAVVAEQAAAHVADLNAANQSWVDQLDVLTGKATQREVDLRNAGDDSTRSLMEAVFALQDINDAAEAAAAAADKLKQALQGLQYAADQYRINSGSATALSLAQGQQQSTWNELITKFPGIVENGFSELDIQRFITDPSKSGEIVNVFGEAGITMAQAYINAVNSVYNAQQALNGQSSGSTTVDTSAADKAAQEYNDTLTLQGAIYALRNDQVGEANVLEAQHALILKDLTPAMQDLQKELWNLEAAAKAAASTGGVLQRLSASIGNMRKAVEAADSAVLSAQDNIRSKYMDAQQKVNDLLLQASQNTLKFVDSINEFLGTLGKASASNQSLTSLKAGFSSTAVLAKSGDAASQEKLVGQAGTLLEAARAQSRSAVEYARSEAFVRATLEGVTKSLAPQTELAKVADTSIADQIIAAQAEQSKWEQLAADTNTSILVSTDSVALAAQATADQMAALRAAYDAAVIEQSAANLKLEVALAALDLLGLSESGLALLLATQTSEFATALGVSLGDIKTLAEALGLTQTQIDDLTGKLNITVADEVYEHLGIALGPMSGLYDALGVAVGAPADFMEKLGTALGLSPLQLLEINSALNLTPEQKLALSGVLTMSREQTDALATAIGYDNSAIARLGTVIGLNPAALTTLTNLDTAIGLAIGVDAIINSLPTAIGFSTDAATTAALLGTPIGISDDAVTALFGLGTALGISDEELQRISDSFNLTPEQRAQFEGLLALNATDQAALATALGYDATSIAALATALGYDQATIEALAGSVGLNSTVLTDLLTSLGLNEDVSTTLGSAVGLQGTVLTDLLTSLGLQTTVTEELASSVGLNETVLTDLLTSLGLNTDVTTDLANAVGLQTTVTTDLATSVGLMPDLLNDLSESVGLSAAAKTALDGYLRAQNLAGVANRGANSQDTIGYAYRSLFGRDPEQAGRDYWAKSGLTGAELVYAIADAAQNGQFDDITAKRLRGFAVGTNYVTSDGPAYLHAGETVTPRPFVDMQREARDETNALLGRLLASNEKLSAEVAQLRKAADSTATSSKKTSDTLVNVTRGGNAMVTTV